MDSSNGFYDGLVDEIHRYSGKYKESVKYTPSFFKLLCDLVESKFIDWNSKLLIDASLAYFVIPNDIIPDHLEEGYLDDLHIITHVLKILKSRNYEKEIKENWNGEGNIFELIEKLYDETYELLGQKKIFEILRLVGLHKFESLDFVEYSGEYSQKIAKLANEKRELLGLISFLTRQLYSVKTRGLNVEQIKKVIEECGDYSEIERILEIAKRDRVFSNTSRVKNPSEDLSIEEELLLAREQALGNK